MTTKTAKQPARMSAKEYLAEAKPEAKSKYGAKITFVDGIQFMSRAEAARYCQLKMLERSLEICNLELQPVYRIPGKSRKCVMKYVGDFYYYDKQTMKYILEDVKGMLTPVYKLKKKMVEDYFGVTITEIKLGAKEQREAFSLYGVEL